MQVEIHSAQGCRLVIADAEISGPCNYRPGSHTETAVYPEPCCTGPEAPLQLVLRAIGRENLLFHTMVGSNDIERSKRFYNAVLGALGVGEATLNIAGSGHTRLFYRDEGGGTNFVVTEPINDQPADVANGSTVAFSCSSPEQVGEFHAVAIANGGTSIEDLPGPRETGMGKIHLAYVRDPDGNKLCGIHIPG